MVELEESVLRDLFPPPATRQSRVVQEGEGILIFGG
jgi:hypothetical protein